MAWRNAKLVTRVRGNVIYSTRTTRYQSSRINSTDCEESVTQRERLELPSPRSPFGNG